MDMMKTFLKGYEADMDREEATKNCKHECELDILRMDNKIALAKKQAESAKELLAIKIENAKAEVEALEGILTDDSNEEMTDQMKGMIAVAKLQAKLDAFKNKD